MRSDTLGSVEKNDQLFLLKDEEEEEEAAETEPEGRDKGVGALDFTEQYTRGFEARI